MTDNRLAGKVAIVTGSASGLGEAIARRLVAEGARVVIADVHDDAGQALAGELGPQSAFVHLDVGDEDQWRAALDWAVESFGGLHILVNNAGIVVPSAAVQDTTLEQFDRLVQVNLRGTYLGCRAAYPLLCETQGCVLNISSMAGVTGQARHAIYSATKGAINALTRSTAVDWGPARVRINALCPAAVRTPALEEWARQQPNVEEIEDYLARIHSLGYCPGPESVASVAAFLCSDDASFVTGCIMPVSGGSECGYKL
jgi:meso-butanediol dehydrogenase/(S,S)-butanediol dehydrogenase/diacetyl reductase